MIVALLLMTLIMFLFVNIWSNVAVEYDVKHNLARELRKNLKCVSLEHGELVFDTTYVSQEEGIYFLLLNSKGEVVAGSYPQDFDVECDIKFNWTRTVQGATKTFYVRDMQHIKSLGTEYFMRGIVSKKDVYSQYQTLRYFSYLSIFLVFCVVVSCALILSRRISKSLQRMCNTANMIGQDFKVSARVEEDYNFYELEVLAQAENRMIDRFERTLREQEQFTSDVAHELRIPIAVILAQCEYTKNRGVGLEEQAEALEVIERQAGKVKVIISQLLRLSRLEQGRIKIQQENIDLAEIVQVVCKDEQEKAGDKVEIVQHLEKIHVLGDISLIAIAIQNLINNAAKFSYDGGVIEVSMGKQEKNVYVSVKDHGSGIGKEDIKMVFKHFYKGDESRNSDGIGLGLPLALKIAEKHGGTIRVFSKEGKGSEFILILPEKTL